MQKPYSGNVKPFVLVLFQEKDREKVLPVLEGLEKKGLVLCGQDGRATEKQAGKACTTVAFLSESFAKDEEKQKVLFAADAAGQPMIPVRLDNAKQPEVLERAIYAKNAIQAERYSAEELVNRIAGAESLNPPALTERQKRGSRLRIGLILAAAVLVLGIAVLMVLDQRMGLGIIFPTPTPVPTATPTPVPTPTPRPTPTPTPIVDPVYTQSYGFTDADLREIQAVMIIGDRFRYFTREDGIDTEELSSAGTWAVRSYEEDGVHWYWKEDGSEVQRKTYDDLSFLNLMPNLECLSFCCADIGSLPDLSGTRLFSIEYNNCTLPDLEWLRGAPRLTHVNFSDVQDGLDFSPLSGCPNLNGVSIHFGSAERAGLTGFAPPRLKNIVLSSDGQMKEIGLDSMAACDSLEYIQLTNLPVRDLNFLEGKQRVRQLFLYDLDSLSDIAPAESLEQLREFDIRNCRQIRDFSALTPCEMLERFAYEGESPLRDLSFLEGKANLNELGLTHVDVADLNFLKSIRVSKGISLYIGGNVRDWSALGDVHTYLFLNLASDDRDFSRISPWLEKPVIRQLQLSNFRDPDLSTLPRVYDALWLWQCEGLEDLKGLPSMITSELFLYDLPDLRSLDGVKALMSDERIQTMEIWGCPRLTDWSALDGCTVGTLRLIGTYMVPEMDRFSVERLSLESVAGLEDLTCLEKLSPRSLFSLRLIGLEGVEDLSPVRKVKGNTLIVSPQFQEQAESIVAEGLYKRCEVEYPEGGWQPWKGEVRLKSLEDLDTLTRAALARVDNLRLAGDLIADWDRYDVWSWDDWNDGHRHRRIMVRNRETGEEREAESGSLQDLTRLSALSGLRNLEIMAQPIVSLEGAENLRELEEFTAEECPELTDLTALFSLEKVRRIRLSGVPADSIQGIQNLAELRELSLDFTGVTDISPLAECDFTGTGAEEEGLSLSIFGEEPLADCTPLEHIRHFGTVSMNGQNAWDWLAHMQGAVVEKLNMDNVDNEDAADLTMLGGMKVKRMRIDSFPNLKSLHGIEELLEEGILEELEILGCPRLMDWSALKSGYLSRLWLYGTYTIPDLTGTKIGTIRLEQMNWLKELNALLSIGQEQEVSLELVNLENLKDLSALKKLRGNRLAVTEDLMDRAREIVRGGSFRTVEEADEDGWGVSNDRFMLASMEELETLPENVLGMVSGISLAGGRVFDSDRFDIHERWENDRRILMLHAFETDEETEIEPGTMTDLTSLAKLTGLRELKLFNQPLTSLEGIENMPDLEVIEIQDAPELTDFSALSGMKNLRSIVLNGTGIRSIEGIEKLQSLEELSIFDELADLSPLERCSFDAAYRNGGVNLYLNTGEETDLSPLRQIREYSRLQLDWQKKEKWTPYIQDAVIHNLQINDDTMTTLEGIPAVTDRLEIHGGRLTDLKGIKDPCPQELQLDGMPRLKSLEGIRGLTGEGKIRVLEIGGCPGLTDWSALEGAEPEIVRIYGDLVFLPTELENRAERTEKGWWNDDVQFSPESLEQLQSAPEELLCRMTELMIAGDSVYDADRYELRELWKDDGEPVLLLWDRETGEEIVPAAGTDIDLSFLNRMTGLRRLGLHLQPVTDLEMLRPLTQLTELEVTYCKDLKDISAIADIPELERLDLNRSGVTSLEGIQGRSRLWYVNLSGTKVSDLSPLSECDFRFAEQERQGLEFLFDQEAVTDFSALSGVPSFRYLAMGNIDASLWAETVKNARVYRLVAFAFTDQRVFAEFMEAHPELEDMNIPWNEEVTDLSMLAGMRNLRFVSISGSMEKAVKSLEGLNPEFELEIQ